MRVPSLLDDLRADVARRYDRLGLPSWPDPHADVHGPADDEYGRVTDPERFRIVHARATAWVDVLVSRLGARTEPVGPQDGTALPGEDRGLAVVPPRDGAMRLLLLEREGDADTPGLPAPLEVAVVRPDVVLETVPVCACDACDPGSAALLDEVDDAIGHVVAGETVVLRHPRWSATWQPGGASLSGGGRRMRFDRAMELCRRVHAGERVRLPWRTEAFAGAPWGERG